MPPADHDRPEKPDAPRPAPRRYRFEPAGGLIAAQVRKAGEKRGFAVARLLTHWAEVAGPDLARLCRPQRISYARKGFGATLVLETPGAAAPLVAMRLDALRERINAVYGHAAIARIQLVQGGGMVALDGMAEAQAPFAGPGFRYDNLAPPSGAAMARARETLGALTEGVADQGLKSALDALALNVLGRGGRSPAPGRTDGKDTR